MPVEVKVLSKVLTNRLKPLMASLVHPDQKGFIPGRSIHHQVMLVRDLQHLVTSRCGKGVATFLDFAKAYDSVNREYLFKVIECQGFGPKFLSWIRLLYNGSQCSLMLNGWAQTALEPSRGVKQGYPLSPFLFALSLEPLGNLLRAERELGVKVDETLSIPVAFFADDTVLFSMDARCVKQQLQLVDLYCAGSGAMLNPEKSMIMSLNNHQVAPIVEPLRSQRMGDTVKYLGIPFGNFDTSTLMAKTLDEKLMTRLRLWKGRARTLLGRRLIVQAVIISWLWYFTTTIIIPVRFINRWQGVVTRYVLYNRVSTGSGGINIVKKGLATQSRADDGFGVLLAVIVERQRLMLLQQFIQVLSMHKDDSDTVWYRPIAELLRRRYGAYSRKWSGDFLLQNPPKPPGWRATMLPLWWRKLLKDWKRIHWPLRVSLRYTRAKTVQYALYSPMWWNISSAFQVWHHQDLARQPLGVGTNSFRCLCRHLATKQIWCLADLLDTSHQWPNSFDFFCKVRSLAMPLLGSRIKVNDIFNLYRQLTQVFRRVLPHPEAGGVRASSRGAFPLTFGVQADKGVVFYPNLRLSDWNILLQSTQAVDPHPMRELGCPQMRIHSTLSQYISLRWCLITVVHDVLLRLLFGDLIVGSRLHFLKSLNPTIQQCVRESCVTIETLEHCFFSCPGLKEMWQSLWLPWSKAFTSDLSWRLLLFPQSRDIHADWKRQHKVLLLLWRVHTAIVFHATWRLRNKIHFKETETEQVSTQSLLNSFHRHCQHIYLHSEELELNGNAVISVLQGMGFDPPKPRSLPQPSDRIWILRQ